MLMKLTRFVDVFLDTRSVLHVFTPRFLCLIVGSYIWELAHMRSGTSHLCLFVYNWLSKTKKSILFAAVVIGTLFISVEDLPDKILEEAFTATLPLRLGSFLCTVVWVLVAFPSRTANAPADEHLALTIVRAFSPRSGAAAGNAPGPSGSDVFSVFFSSFMVLGLCYLQCTIGSLISFGLAHVVYLILTQIALFNRLCR